MSPEIVPNSHQLTIQPQPMAEQMRGDCSCGHWTSFASVFAYPGEGGAAAELRRQHAEHLGCFFGSTEWRPVDLKRR